MGVLLVLALFLMAYVVQAETPAECQPRTGPHVTVPIFHVIGKMRPFGGILWPQGATDGNAIFERDGIYHIMHQTTHDTPAGAAVPNHSAWGHVVSRDLVHWVRIADALQFTNASRSYDWHDGDCDGTVTLDSGGLSDAPIMTFGPDCGRDLSNDSPRVGIARPANASDPFLEGWVKDGANPVDFGSSPPCSFSGRIWRSRDGEHINMICAINSMGNQWGRYTTTNATLHGPWTLVDASFATWSGPEGSRAVGSISAPSFLPLPAASAGQPTHIINSLGGAGFLLGEYDEQHERLHLSGAEQRAEGGAQPLANWFVAGASPREGRLLHFGFLEAAPYNGSEPRGFAHTCFDHGYLCPLTSVRELSYDAPSQRLVANPVDEYVSLRNATLLQLERARVAPERPLRLALPPGTGAAMDVQLWLELPLAEEPLAEDISVGIAVLASPTGDALQATRLTLHVSAPRRNGTRLARLALDAPRIRHAQNATFELRAAEAAVQLRVLVDRSIVEAFAAGGRAVLSTRDYPRLEDLAASVWSPTGAMLNVSAWEMGCGWTNREDVLLGVGTRAGAH